MTTTAHVPLHRRRALLALAALRTWNQAILDARQEEERTGQPGRFEYALRTGDANPRLHTRAWHAERTLDRMEQTARSQGLSRDVFYALLGKARPEPLPEGPHVGDWFTGQR